MPNILHEKIIKKFVEVLDDIIVIDDVLLFLVCNKGRSQSP